MTTTSDRLRSFSPAHRLLLFIAAVLSVASGFAAYQGPVPAATDVYGGPGPYSVVTETIPSPDWPAQVVTIFRPSGVSGPRPTWFFSHGFGATSPDYYREFLTHLASHGEVVVFSPYPILSDGRPDEAYAIMFDGFVAAANRYASLIDTTRVGFAGHSYGGGAVPALALRAWREKNWGANGLALLILAPWYSFSVSNEDLASFPMHTQAIVQIYEADPTNDHRMAIDLFRHFNLSPAQRNFLTVRNDRIDGYNYNADHLTPTGPGAPRATAVLDALDSWGLFRIAQALSASALEGDTNARAIALGNGSPAQVQMGSTPGGRALRPMIESDQPVPLYSQDRYTYRWDSPTNPRRGEPLPSPSLPPRLINVSARAKSADGADVLIVGAVVAGDRPKNLLVRAVGPGLKQFGLAAPMTNPLLRTFDGQTPDITVDDWEQAPGLEAFQATSAGLGLFTLAAGSKDAALLASFKPGAITMHAPPADGAAGVTLLELYDVEQDASSRLSNLSSRARVGTSDDILIAGFISTGEGSLRVLIRGIGPSLAGFGVPDALADPVLEIYRGSERIAMNDNWSADPLQTSAIAEATAKIGAFPIPLGSADACIVLDLPAGGYTAQLRGQNGKSGVGLLEIYVVP